MAAQPKRIAYIFLDEGGNLDFKPSGSTYFMMTSVLTYRPFGIDASLTDLKFNLIERGFDVEYFHCSTDKQEVRDRVFSLIKAELSNFRLDSIIVRKRKTAPAVQVLSRFYPDTLGYLLRYIMHPNNTKEWSDVIVITDQLPMKNKRQAIRKAIQQSLAAKLPKGVPYKILHHDSKSCPGLQVADYCNWAIGRKWERGDERSYEYIRPAIKSEFDIFQYGHTEWY